MPIGTTLAQMLLDLRAELLQSVNPTMAVNVAPVHKRKLRRVQTQLWLDFAWPHLRVDRDVALAAGQRYYDFPDDLDFLRVETVQVKYSSRWRPLDRGVSEEQMNAFDSDADVRADPALRWAPYGEVQFEVWPIPVADGLQTIRFRGIRKIADMPDDDSPCEIDSDLIVLSAAAELADSKTGLSQRLEARARALYDKLKQRSESNDSGRFSRGGVTAHAPMRGRRQAPPLVAVDRGA